MRIGLPALGALAAAAGLAAPAPAEAAPRIVVKSERQFQEAVARVRGGGTIVLRPGRYGRLSVGPRKPRLLVVRALRGTVVRELRLRNTRNLRFENLLVANTDRPAAVRVERSSKITFTGLTLRGRDGRAARMLLPESTGVTIARSRFSRCGERAACILLGRSGGVRILDSRFQDCFGCDFVRGRVTDGLVLRGNHFHRSLPSSCGIDPATCNHNDLVQLQAGENVLVERNVFGVYQLPGAGQLYLAGPVHGVTVRDNVFLAGDPSLPGLPVPPNGIVLGNRKANGPLDVLPTNVTIAHNTILSGAPRGVGQHADLANSLAVSPRYAALPETERPRVANNVFALTGSPDHLCGLARMAANVTITGTVCSGADMGGDPRLSPAGVPGAESTLVIDRGVQGFSVVDLLGRPRDPAPDIGAYEYVPGP